MRLARGAFLHSCGSRRRARPRARSHSPCGPHPPRPRACALTPATAATSRPDWLRSRAPRHARTHGSARAGPSGSPATARGRVGVLRGSQKWGNGRVSSSPFLRPTFRPSGIDDAESLRSKIQFYASAESSQEQATTFPKSPTPLPITVVPARQASEVTNHPRAPASSCFSPSVHWPTRPPRPLLMEKTLFKTILMSPYPVREFPVPAEVQDDGKAWAVASGGSAATGRVSLEDE